MKEYKIGMVAAEFNFEVTSLMIERAKAEAEFLGVKIVKTILVPGVFEIPMAVTRSSSHRARGRSWTSDWSTTSPWDSESPAPA